MTPVKIGFVLLSNSQHPIPSTRIAVLNMLPFLRAANFDPHIVFEPEYGTENPDVTDLGRVHKVLQQCSMREQARHLIDVLNSLVSC